MEAARRVSHRCLSAWRGLHLSDHSARTAGPGLVVKLHTAYPCFLAYLEQPPPIIVISTGKARNLLLPHRPLWVRKPGMRMQPTIGIDVDQPHALAGCPGATALDLHPPIVVAVTHTVTAEAGYFLLSGDRRWKSCMTVQIPPRSLVLQPNNIAVLYWLSCAIIVGLPIRTLDTPEVVIVVSRECRYLLLS